MSRVTGGRFGEPRREDHARHWEAIASLRAAREAGCVRKVARLSPIAEQAREALIRAHLPLVRSIALRCEDRIDLSDRLSAGMAGLDEAIWHFDTAKGSPFSWYASLWIRKAIKRETDLLGYPCRIPAWLLERGDAVAGRHSAEAFRALCRPTIDAAEMEDRLANRADTPHGTDTAPHHGDPWGRAIEDLHAGVLPPDQQVAQETDGDALRRAIQALCRRKRAVIRRRFGLDCEPQTLEKVARRYRLSASGVRNIQNAALRELATILGESR